MHADAHLLILGGKSDVLHALRSPAVAADVIQFSSPHAQTAGSKGGPGVQTAARIQ